MNFFAIHILLLLLMHHKCISIYTYRFNLSKLKIKFLKHVFKVISFLLTGFSCCCCNSVIYTIAFSYLKLNRSFHDKEREKHQNQLLLRIELVGCGLACFYLNYINSDVNKTNNFKINCSNISISRERERKKNK